MIALTDRQLQYPDDVAPYRAFAELLRILQSRPGLPRPAKFLDIGAGAGAYGELLERWAPGAFAYTGADYSAEIVAAARQRWPGRRFEQRDLFSPGALDGFDVVLASAVLDIMADVGPALEALLASDARWVVLHRQRLDPVRTRVEVTSGYRGQRTYASYLREDELAEAADRHGRRVTASVIVDDGIRSFVLERQC
jgi:SAM-dependent methyltransferase